MGMVDSQAGRRPSGPAPSVYDGWQRAGGAYRRLVELPRGPRKVAVLAAVYPGDLEGFNYVVRVVTPGLRLSTGEQWHPEEPGALYAALDALRRVVALLEGEGTHV